MRQICCAEFNAAILKRVTMVRRILALQQERVFVQALSRPGFRALAGFSVLCPIYRPSADTALTLLKGEPLISRVLTTV